MTACRCPTAEAALACRRAGTVMVEPLRLLCQRSPEYRALWDRLALGEQQPAAPAPDGKARLKSCRHRGLVIRGAWARGVFVRWRKGLPLLRYPP